VRHTIVLVLAAVLTGGIAFAQQAPATPAAEKPVPAKPSAPEGLPTNIKIDITITDQAGPGEAAKRTVSMIVADRKVGSIRSSGTVITSGVRSSVSLNLDASPVIVKDGVLRLDLGLEYAPKPGSDNANSGEGRAQLNERLGLVVESGKAMVISQASDPTSDRKIVVELTATILK